MTKHQQKKEVNKLHEKILIEKTDTFYEKAKLEQDPKEKEDLLLALDIVESIKAEGGLALVVGGYARDETLRRFNFNVKPKDIDIEVYGIEFEKLKSILARFGKPNIVGASFGVIKLGNLDISLPRKDSKTGKGHKGFTIKGDPYMNIVEATRRRDFTINALALDPLTGGIIDKFGGIDDIQNHTLRATDLKLFGDDPLRVLRAMQFAGRFGFKIDSNTMELCKRIDLTELSRERIGEEWIKLLLKSPKPSVGLKAAQDLGVIDQLHPEIKALFDLPQDEEWHPEKDVWIHTMMVVDAAADLIQENKLSKDDALVIMLASLCHDFGKPATTEEKDGRIISHEHAEKGEVPTKSFLNYIKIPHDVIQKVVPLVKEHLYPTLVKDAGDSAIKKLANRIAPATIAELVLVAEADHRGRALKWDGFPEGKVLLEKAELLALKEAKPKPLVLGRHLIAKGFSPGRHFGIILGALFEAQLDGKFTTLEGGLEYFDKHKTELISS